MRTITGMLASSEYKLAYKILRGQYIRDETNRRASYLMQRDKSLALAKITNGCVSLKKLCAEYEGQELTRDCRHIYLKAVRNHSSSGKIKLACGGCGIVYPTCGYMPVFVHRKTQIYLLCKVCYFKFPDLEAKPQSRSKPKPKGVEQAEVGEGEAEKPQQFKEAEVLPIAEHEMWSLQDYKEFVPKFRVPSFWELREFYVRELYQQGEAS